MQVIRHDHVATYTYSKLLRLPGENREYLVRFLARQNPFTFGSVCGKEIHWMVRE